MTLDEKSDDRIRKSVRLGATEWVLLCRVADVYYSGQPATAMTAAVLDALNAPTLVPSAPSAEFTEAVAKLAEVTAERLNLTKKVFYYSPDVVTAVRAAIDVFPAAAPEKPLLRDWLANGTPPLPSTPQALIVPITQAAKLPATKLREFVVEAISGKATRLGLTDLPSSTTGRKAVLPAPRALPCIESIQTGRHLDEALVAILVALPSVAPFYARDSRISTSLRWLRSALTLREHQ